MDSDDRYMDSDQRRKIITYLGEYSDFIEVCKEQEPDLSSMELAILHHGYVTGGQQNA